ncbi:helix-turn-helix domain-containing protein [Streptomyces sp. CAI-85]|uniref:helix-turn-helix domain-containing protein n=1 Tax=Streptomyces sp. CAI-85 TaxID=1472662 RepID=UPI001C316BBB|nr:helix-turn-helix transcriptional regulator [Streptomyces sp. CAI-85]
MSQSIDEHTGARIARVRKQRGLTQQGLAMRAHVSKSLLSKVECGQKDASPMHAFPRADHDDIRAIRRGSAGGRLLCGTSMSRSHAVRRGSRPCGACCTCALQPSRVDTRHHADARLAEARALALATGELPDFGVTWGLVNVGVHAVAIASEADDFGRAIELAEEVRIPRGWTRSRAGHH